MTKPMNKIEQLTPLDKKNKNYLTGLIEELCPQGVEVRALGEITNEYKERNKTCSISEVRSVTNNAGLVRTDDYFDNVRTSQNTSNYKLVEQGMFVYNPSRINVGSIAQHKEAITIIVSPMYIIVELDESQLLPEYLNLFLSSELGKSQILNKVEVGARFRLTYGAFARIKIPTPPLAIQEEIVKILDNFTQLEAELEAELEARKKQYEHYREELLSFGDDVEWKALGEVCTVITDGSHFSPHAVENGYNMFSVKDMRYNNFDSTSCKKISQRDFDTLVKNGCKPILNDVLIAKDGSMLKYAFPVKDEEDIVILSSIAILRPKLDIICPKYFAHYFRQENFRKIVIRDYSSRGGVPRIVLKSFKKIIIPIPPLSKQKEIVAILDKFDALVNDISTGLPAEIAARKKQYEYYRNQLLEFKVKSYEL